MRSHSPVRYRGSLIFSFLTVLTGRHSDCHWFYIKETHFFIISNVCYLNFYIISKPWFYTFFFNISYLLLLSIWWFYKYNNFMALNSLLCADVPLRNCSLSHWLARYRLQSADSAVKPQPTSQPTCLFACLHSSKTYPNFMKFSTHVTSVHCSVLLWRCYVLPVCEWHFHIHVLMYAQSDLLYQRATPGWSLMSATALSMILMGVWCRILHVFPN